MNIRTLVVRIGGFLVLFVAAFFVQQGVGYAATLTVDSTADNTTGDGDCTLREAIGNANGNANTNADCVGSGAYGADTIEFNIAGSGPHVISLTSALPNVSDDLVIDGISQTGASCGTLATGTSHTLMIEIDASSAGNINVFTLQNGDITVRGLAIHSAQDSGSFGEGTAVRLETGSNYTVECNYVGTNAAGTTVNGNETAGLFLLNATNTIISNNLVAGSGLYGIASIGAFGSSSGVSITGNLVGADLTRSINAAYANNTGVNVQGAATDSIIGGTTATTRNYIFGNTEGNVMVGSFGGGVADNIAILGNHIYGSPGTAGAGLGFAGLGIDLYLDADGNQQPDTSGVTANDAGDGDSGPNEFMNFPVISSATGDGTDTEVAFSLDVPAGDYRIEFFSNDIADASGNGEGQTFIGSASVTSAGSGSEDFTATLSGFSAVSSISATTTEDLGGGNFGSTSEFSAVLASTVVESGGSGSNGSNPEDNELADTGVSGSVYIVIATSLIGLGLLARRRAYQ